MPFCFRLGVGLGHRLRFWFRLLLHTCALGHVDGAHRAVGIDGPRRAFVRAGAGGQLYASGLGSGQQVGLVHRIQKIGLVLFAVLVHGLVVVNDNVKGGPRRWSGR